MLIIYIYEALDLEHKGVPLLALSMEPEDLKKELEPTATLLAPWRAAIFLIGGARLNKAAREARQQGDGNPSCLVAQATIATS